jgi:hypothetical protein
MEKLLSASIKLSVCSVFMNITEPTPENNGLHLANAYNLLVSDKHKNYNKFYDYLKYAWHVLIREQARAKHAKGKRRQKTKYIGPVVGINPCQYFVTSIAVSDDARKLQKH